MSIFSKNFGQVKDFVQNCHFWPPWTCPGWKCQFFQKYWPALNKKCWPDPGFCSKLLFLTTADISRMIISTFPKILAGSRILLKNCHFWPPRTCQGWKFQFLKKCWPDPGFCSKLSFLTSADISRMKILTFAKMLARSRILLKIVIFDHRGHVEDENVNFSKNIGRIKNFAQNCNFWPPRTCPVWKFNFSKNVCLMQDWANPFIIHTPGRFWNSNQN